MGTKKLKRISVRTLSNGYSLEFDGQHEPNGYMYYDMQQLLEGIFLRLGIANVAQYDKERMKEYVEAAAKWRDNKENVEEIIRLQSQLKQMETSRNAIARQLVDERNRFLNTVDNIRMMSAEYKDFTSVSNKLKAMISNYNKTRRLTLRELRVTSTDITDHLQLEDDDD